MLKKILLSITLFFFFALLLPKVLVSAESVKISFYNSKEWENVYIYMYDLATNTTIGTEYPGEPMTLDSELGDKWYSIVLDSPIIGSHFIFNDGDAASNSVNKKDCTYSDASKLFFNAYKRDGFATSADCQNPDNNKAAGSSTSSITVYFYNSRRWSVVNAYTYSTDEQDEYLKPWPGNLTKKETRDNWYSISVPVDIETTAFNIIFNNGSAGGTNQSVDAIISSGESIYVNFNGEVFTSFELTEASIELLPVTEVEIINPEDVKLDLTQFTAGKVEETIVEEPSLGLPIILVSVFGLIDVLGVIGFLLLRKKSVKLKT